MLPFLPQHLHASSGVLQPPEQPVVTPAEESALSQFMIYMQRTWLPPNGQFYGRWHDAHVRTTRTTNLVEGFHPRIRHAFGERDPTLRELLPFCASELTMAKSTLPAIEDGSAPDRYIRPDEQERQRRVHEEVERFAAIPAADVTPRVYTRYLDSLADLMALP